MRHFLALVLATTACGTAELSTESNVQGVTAVEDSLLKDAVAQCETASRPFEFFLSKAPRHAEHYDAVLAWLYTSEASQRRSRCMGNAIRYLAAAQPRRSVADLIAFIEGYADTKVHAGDFKSFDQLIRSAEGFNGLSLALRSGKLSTSDSQLAFNYLKDSTRPSKWSARSLSWSWADEASLREAHVILVKFAIAAIGLSGHPEAVSSLKALKNEPEVIGVFPAESTAHTAIDGWIEGAHKP